jgi:hypothetical protein
MRLIFVDDSTQKGFRAGMGQLLALGAAIFPEQSVKPFDDGVKALFTKLGVPDDVEMKWSAPKGHWYKTTASPGLRDQLQDGVLTLAKELHVVTVCVIFDTGRTTLQGYEAKKQILKYLYERVSMALGDDVGIIIADKPGGGPKDETKWLADTHLLTSRGTTYVTPKAVVLPVLTAPSDHLRHIQLADLVVGATTAAVSGNNKSAARLVPQLMGLAHRHPSGSVGGTGIKLFPDALINLHYWVFGETTYYRRTSLPLPLPMPIYGRDDGCGTAA